MARAVEHRADQLGHAGIGDEMPARLGPDHPRQEPAGLGDDAPPRLDDEPRRVRQVRSHRRGVCLRCSGEAATETNSLGTGLGGEPRQHRRELHEGLQVAHVGADVRADRLRPPTAFAHEAQRHR